jgi:hypothetical protein
MWGRRCGWALALVSELSGVVISADNIVLCEHLGVLQIVFYGVILALNIIAQLVYLNLMLDYTADLSILQSLNKSENYSSSINKY